MRKLLLACALGAFALVGAGCKTFDGQEAPNFLSAFQTDVAIVEAKIAQFVAKVKAQYPVALADAKNAVSLACGIAPTVQTSIANFSGTLSNPSPKVASVLTAASQDASTAVAACAQYTAQMNSPSPPTLSQTVNFGLAIWNAYQAGKTAYQQAEAAASGS